jgi:hypothetical protein
MSFIPSAEKGSNRTSEPMILAGDLLGPPEPLKLGEACVPN